MLKIKKKIIKKSIPNNCQILLYLYIYKNQNYVFYCAKKESLIINIKNVIFLFFNFLTKLSHLKTYQYNII